MPVFTLDARPVFPDPGRAEPDGLLAVGGDLGETRLLNAYRAGIFPWYAAHTPILWWSPPERALILPGEQRQSRRTARATRRGKRSRFSRLPPKLSFR